MPQRNQSKNPVFPRFANLVLFQSLFQKSCEDNVQPNHAENRMGERELRRQNRPHTAEERALLAGARGGAPRAQSRPQSRRD